MKGIESPSARASGRHRVAPVARLGLRECQNIPSPLQRAKEDNFSQNTEFRNSLSTPRPFFFIAQLARSSAAFPHVRAGSLFFPVELLHKITRL
jgi:hypothetical protein